MRRGGWWLVALILVVGGIGVAVFVVDPAEPEEPVVAVKKASFDSEAPVTAPAHWLPPEDWVYNHWLPYDEDRLYELLGVGRGAIWRRLRDDRHNLAGLAAEHG